MTGCVTEGCGQTAAARAVTPILAATLGTAQAFTIIRPITGPAYGDPLCLDCVHAAVDDMLMAATPPGAGPNIERHQDPT